MRQKKVFKMRTQHEYTMVISMVSFVVENRAEGRLRGTDKQTVVVSGNSAKDGRAIQYILGDCVPWVSQPPTEAKSNWVSTKKMIREKIDEPFRATRERGIYCKAGL
jgi:hypothetical protein